MDEITCSFPNFNGAAVEVWELTFYRACDYLFMQGLKLIHISKRAHDAMVYQAPMN